ncbi:LOW QUALITY PROTEIN: chromosome transmission fidelity protein 18 homolog, partial [Xenia sp. Carnegie-2017]|uniref:LOW QUALITY PROTEIN: chromosome transmission fidelity protein 18 homolog n=1 Tax=Xenia sp. Carnegie-2017 TaxID=2897299 RepID=UPI001F0364F6
IQVKTSEVRLDLNTVSTIDSANRTFNENESYRSTTHSVNARPKVFTRPLIGEDCVSVTGTDGGRRVYLHIKREESKEMVKAKFLDGKTPVNLLGVPFSVLRETIYEEVKSRKLTETLNKSYIELLSDDGINRNLLTWLKLWDGVVFGKENVKTRRKHDEKIQKRKIELDVTGRPSHKIALLCGPPGLGKTTLAHIVALHAGYNVVELPFFYTFSDDRSVEVFRNKIESTTQMQSVLDSGKRPNCLVIDEIDGAPTPAINVLLSLIKRRMQTYRNAQKKRKKRYKHVILSRPIICICNDPYVPALRQLRQLAFVLTFLSTMSGRLAQRLLEVSRKELFQTDMSTLLALCEKTENDIRSCLNTLQFLRQRGEVLSIEYIQSENIGLKDSQKSLFSLWKAVFQLPRAKNKRLATLIEPLNEPSPMLPEFGSDDPRGHPVSKTPRTFYNLLHLVSSNGQYNKLENGIFENYLNMKFKDSYLNQVVMATECLSLTLRTINMQLFSSDEKQQMRDLINTMITYNINYLQERNIEGQYSYIFDPKIEEAVKFPGLPQHKQLTYAMKQLIAREVWQYYRFIFLFSLLILASVLVSSSVKSLLRACCSANFFVRPKELKLKTGSKCYKTMQCIGKQHQIKTLDWSIGDQFLHQITPDEDTRLSLFHLSDDESPTDSTNSHSPFWFKFQEGFSNAVRRPVKIQDLL